MNETSFESEIVEPGIGYSSRQNVRYNLGGGPYADPGKINGPSLARFKRSR